MFDMTKKFNVIRLKELHISTHFYSLGTKIY